MRKFCQNLQNAQLCRPKTGILSAFLPSAAGQNSDTFPVLHTVERGVSLQGREKIGDVPLPSCRFASSHTPPFVAMRHLPPERGKSSLKGTAFGGGGEVSGIAQRRPLGGAGCERSEQTEGVPAARLFLQETSAAAAVSLHAPTRENTFGALRRARQTRNIKYSFR